MNEITLTLPELHMLIARSHMELSKMDVLAKKYDLTYEWSLDEKLSVDADFISAEVEMAVAL